MLAEFIKFLENEVKNGSIYVWGGQGQLATEALIDKLETSASNKKTAKALLAKRRKQGYKNIKAFDCSGLVTEAMSAAGMEADSFDTTAQGLQRSYCTSITRSALKPGDLVFRQNSKGTYHVGVVVDFNLNVIESRGRAYGVVKRGINASGSSYWNAYGRPKKIKTEIEKNTKVITLTRELKKKTIKMRGEDVKAVQTVLINKGFSCGKTANDGVFGNSTDTAVRKFQADSGLKVDGIVGEKTAKALGFTFKK